MFYKEDYSFELSTFSGSNKILEDIKSKAIEQFDRFNLTCDQRNIDVANSMVFKLEDLSYMWALNLELGVQTMAIYRTGYEVPLVAVDQKMPWCGEPHHQHMAEFVNNQMGKSNFNPRRLGAEFIIKQLNLISIARLEENIRELGKWDNAYAARRAILTIDVGTPA